MKTEETRKANRVVSATRSKLVVRMNVMGTSYPVEREKMRKRCDKNREYKQRTFHPTRNRYFCNAIGRCKMLFKTEAEARRYLMYHHAESEGKLSGPCRVYRCNCCDGWHVTHLAMIPERSMMREMQLIDRHIRKHGKYIA